MVDSTLVYLLAGALVTGFSKFSIGGMGLLILPILMVAFPGPEALGIILPMYIITDLMAAGSYRKDISWPIILRIMPLTITGVVVGGWFLSGVDASQFTGLLAFIIVLMLLLGVYLDRSEADFMRHPLSANIIGCVGGFVSIVSNAAGPLVSLYLMEQGLSKRAYISTRAWAFLLINLSKVPLLWSLGLLTTESITISFQGIPGLVLGACIGYWVVGKLKLTQFKWLIRIMATIAAIKLLLIG